MSVELRRSNCAGDRTMLNGRRNGSEGKLERQKGIGVLQVHNRGDGVNGSCDKGQ